MERVNTGIIGTGRIGRLHAEHLVNRIPQARVLAVSDVLVHAAEQCAAELGVPKAYKDYRDILSNSNIQAVFICSSTDTHAKIIREAAQAGKHIFCEKPIALDLAVIDEALAVVADAGVKLQIGFNRRFDANFRRVRERVCNGEIGEPHILRITSRDPEPPPIEYVAVSGGIFLDMMIHDFDMARFLMGSEVQELYSAGSVKVDPAIGKAGDVDTAVVTLQFTNGALGTIDNSRRAVYGYDQRVEVFGSKGMVCAENVTPDRTRLSTAEAVTEERPLYFFVERYTEAFIAEKKAFLTCILEDKSPPVSGEDGRIPVVMGKAAQLSLEQKRPVRLTEISGS